MTSHKHILPHLFKCATLQSLVSLLESLVSLTNTNWFHHSSVRVWWRQPPWNSGFHPSGWLFRRAGLFRVDQPSMASARPTMSGLCRASLFSVSWIFCGILLTAEAQTTSPAPSKFLLGSSCSCFVLSSRSQVSRQSHDEFMTDYMNEDNHFESVNGSSN